MLATQSLRTIDQVRHGKLLITSLDDAMAITVNTIQLQDSTIYIVDNLLSDLECERVLDTSHVNFGFTSLENSYDINDRQSERLCVIDDDIAQLIWNRLAPLHKELGSSKATTDKWTVFGINPCCRISQYRAPSIGFSAHFDTPYVRDSAHRSLLSVVIYLSDVGTTDFYDPPNKILDIAGLTTTEEIIVSGGLNAYTKHTVNAKRGRCVIFSHRVLHSGAPVTTGIKYVLRTDVVFQHSIEPKALAEDTPQVSGLAVEWFREAQNQELDNHIIEASRLYERSASLRRNNNGMQMQVFNIWSLILFYLDMNDLASISACNTTFKAWCARNEATREMHWNKQNPLDRALVEGIQLRRIKERDNWYYKLNPQTRIRRPIMARVPDFLPRFQSRHGAECTFAYTSSIFDSNPDACLRALAMAAVYQFGISKKSKTYVAQYDPYRKHALACSMRELLTCAYRALPLAGAWYHVHTNKTADMSLYKNKSNKYDNYNGSDDSFACFNDEDNEWDDSDSDDGRMNETENDNVPLSLRESMTISIDSQIIASNECRPGEASTSGLADISLEQERDPVAGIGSSKEIYIDDPEKKKKYMASLDCNVHLHLPSYSQFKLDITSNYDNRCRCGMDGQEVIEQGTIYKPMHYNNLIHDFSHTNLQIYELNHSGPPCKCDLSNFRDTAIRHWFVDLERLNIESFQHASCQCTGNGKIPGSEEYRLTYKSQHVLHHLHLFMFDKKFNSEIYYDQGNDSGSEVEDRKDNYKFVKRRKRTFDKQKFPIPSVDSDYFFMSYYYGVTF